MHNVKNNVKQLLMPWKRKLAEFDGEEVQNNDDFGTHPVLQVRVVHSPCTDACSACSSEVCRLACISQHNSQLCRLCMSNVC